MREVDRVSIQATLDVNLWLIREGFDIPRGAWCVFLVILLDEPVSVTAVKDRVAGNMASVSRHCSTLKELGWIRVEADPASGRQKLLSVSPSGAQVRDRLLGRIGEAVSDRMSQT